MSSSHKHSAVLVLIVKPHAIKPVPSCGPLVRWLARLDVHEGPLAVAAEVDSGKLCDAAVGSAICHGSLRNVGPIGHRETGRPGASPTLHPASTVMAANLFQPRCLAQCHAISSGSANLRRSALKHGRKWHRWHRAHTATAAQVALGLLQGSPPTTRQP